MDIYWRWGRDLGGGGGGELLSFGGSGFLGGVGEGRGEAAWGVFIALSCDSLVLSWRRGRVLVIAGGVSRRIDRVAIVLLAERVGGFEATRRHGWVLEG